MEFPYGHTHHQSHHRRDEREDIYPPPSAGPPPPFAHPPPPFAHPPPPFAHPPPPFAHPPPPPPQVTHAHHSSHVGGESHPNYPPPNTDYYPPPPPPTHDFHHPSDSPAHPPPPYTSGSTVQHVSHESTKHDPHHFHPHMPSFIHNHTHHQGADIHNQKPSVRLFCKAESNYSLTIRDGKVILARTNLSDPFQHWIKDEKFSTKVKDEQGFPSFALINKATGQAMKHSIGATHPVQLIPYNPDSLNAVDESILWTLSTDLGDGFRTIRMVNNIRLNVDAFNGDKNHGGVHDGTKIVLWEWKKDDNQRWKIIPY